MRTFALKTIGYIFKDTLPAIKRELTPKAGIALALLNSLYATRYVREKSGAITLPLDQIAGYSHGLIGRKGIYDLASMLEEKGFIKRTELGIEIANFPKAVSNKRPYLQIKFPDFAIPESGLQNDELAFLKECRKPSTAMLLSFLIDSLRVHFMCEGSCFSTMQNIESARIETGYSIRSFRNSLANLASFGIISFRGKKDGKEAALRYPSEDQKIVPSDLLLRAVFGKVSTKQASLAAYSRSKTEEQTNQERKAHSAAAEFYSGICNGAAARLIAEMRIAMDRACTSIRTAYEARLEDLARAEEVLVKRDMQGRRPAFKNRRLSIGGAPAAEGWASSLEERWNAEGNLPDFVAVESGNIPERAAPLNRSI